MSTEEVIQHVSQEALSTGRHPTVMLVDGSERCERIPLWIYEDGELTLDETARAGLNLAFHIGVKEKQPIGEINKLFFVEQGSVGEKPNDIEAIRIDCFDVVKNKNTTSILRIGRVKRNKITEVTPFMIPTKDGKEVPAIDKVSGNPHPCLNAFMVGYRDGTQIFIARR